MTTDTIAPGLAIDETWTVNDVVTRFPSTLPLLSRIRVDSCCGGSQTLATAAMHKHLDLTILLRELRTAARGGDAA